MALKKRPYKGCRDFYPSEMRIREYLFSKMRTAAEAYGYEPYDGPLLEEIDLYKAKSGEELINDQIYSFTDRGEREVAIRPEMTPTLARMVAGVHREVAKPLRWYSIPNLMRYENPQKGRLREHWQYNVDIFGAPEGKGELEILNLVKFFLTSFGATSEMFSILLNDRHVVDAVFNKLLKLDQEKSYKLYKVIDKAKKVTPEKLDTMVREILTSESDVEVFTKYIQLDSFDKLTNFVSEYSITEECKGFIEFAEKVKNLSINEYIQYDPTIVRGLDYYTGIVFEVFDKHPDNRRAIAGGGAYANLLQIFNESPLPGIGFGLGDVTLKDFLVTHDLLPDLSKANHDVFFTYMDESSEDIAFNLSEKLRDLGLKVELNLGTLKFKKIFKLAETKGHNFVIMLGENEAKNNEVQIKNLTTRDAKNISLDAPEEIKNFIKGL